ncbi:MAG: site-2 protease family protein [Oscillatoriaceae bacterium SKW80]|nr:site-2 protease family protein [Oscillatoriaceae bacterium SKYG93]MCX8120230.1 site-2 protease family protein [Oscillatoriaceae bacterium SKW80]MDW8453156.1 site-2 protease family protein [Oscillatoriaceae cyanobacterium SKYGB_i_bin93]HIK28932.1 site-2 protease family protein [Oscillatoriaceae cyanobacterium M7585_C2015_266]
MQSSWRIGSLFGIPLFLDSSWFVVVVLLTIVNRENYAQWGAIVAWGAGLTMTLLLFVSVLLHELGHSLVAQAQGIKVNSITLFLFGGIASLEQESKTPGLAFQVAIAGPIVSISLFFLLDAIAKILPASTLAQEAFLDLGRINLVLALFNMIPGLPLDGGQIVKAIIWKLTSSRLAGVRWAAITGKTLAMLAITLGLTTIFFSGSQSTGGFWITLLGWFCLRNASAYNRLADLQQSLLELTAADAMTREFRIIDADMTLRRFADEYLLADTASSKPYYAASQGRYRGMLFTDDIRFVERSLWESLTLHNIIRPFSDIIKVEEKTPLIEVINLLEIHQLPWITVLSPAGAVAGVIDRGDLVRAVAKKMNLIIPESEINRIKQEGSYPKNFQLAMIAKDTAEEMGKGS